MALDRINTTRFLNDNSQAQRSAREQLKFILAKGDKLLRIMNGRKYLMTAEDFAANKDEFSPKQLSYIDSIYEKTWKATGFDSFTATYKPTKKNI
ncbi:MAG: hypothetical protein ACYC5G_04295 [Candidatus Doudnabacteria bacterium]